MKQALIHLNKITFLIVLILCSVNALAQKKAKDTQTGILTETDPEYVYTYENTKFVPPSDKTLLIMGQSKKNIDEYRVFSKYTNYPAGWSAYWSVTEFSGFEGPWTTSSGDTQDHRFLVDRFDNMVLHSAMWMVGKWGVAQSTINGTYDEVIQQYAAWAKAGDRPVYLRIGYEFDGPHNELEPSEYVEAYKHIVDLMRAEDATNVAFVWHSYAAPTYKGYPVSDWYPGDDYVDWIGISVFFQPYDDISNHKETNAVLDFAKAKKKPVIIAEANPILGIGTKKRDAKIWDDWFVNFFSFCYEKNIKAIAFINENWPRLRIEGIDDWKDARLYNNAKVAEKWLRETNKNRYLRQSPELYEQLGYIKDEQK